MALLELEEEGTQAKIKVVGVGGGGSNAVNTMIQSGLDGVEFVVANTDGQALEASLAPTKMQLGSKLTRGLGAGGEPDKGRNAALEDVEKLAAMFEGCDMVFVTAGMGGGTGTGAAPVIAKVARECGALTVGVVTKPFTFEGARRRRQAVSGITELAKAVDSLITIPNDKLLVVAGDDMSMLDAFREADEVLLNAVQGISDLIQVHGLINVDFADVRAIMSNQGRALMGTGRASGKKRAIEAAKMAIESPLLDEVTVDGATGLLINITGGPDLKLSEVNAATAMIQEAAHPDANIIFGSVIDANLGEEVRITVIATGFEGARSAVIEEPRGKGTPTGSGRGQAASQMALPGTQAAHTVHMIADEPPTGRMLAHEGPIPQPMSRMDSGELPIFVERVVQEASPSFRQQGSERRSAPRQTTGVPVTPRPESITQRIPTQTPPPAGPQSLRGFSFHEPEDEIEIPAFVRRQSIAPRE